MEKQGTDRRTLMALLAGSGLAMATRSSLADDAIDPDANDAVTRMGKTLSTGAFSFRSHTIRQYERDNLPLHIFHSADVLVRRPDDLLADQPGQAFLNGVVTGKKVGDVTIDGQKCNHFFFLQPPGIELELWSETDQRALPRRIAVTYRSVPGEPQFLSQMSDWKVGIDPPDDAFEIKIPAGATKAEGRSQ